MSDTSPHSFKTFGRKFATLMAILSFAAALFLLVNRQWVVDQVSVWQYQPNTAISALTEKTRMSDQGKFYFYASHPLLEGTQEFNRKCNRKEESTAILGCYTGRNIFIYDVTDQQLDGIREVTAAHEMLHAAYDRLGDSERKSLAGLLDAEYNKLKGDKKLAERMAFYARTEPGERENELHSVIGTEVPTISQALELHYKRYFIDRGHIVGLHSKYESVFTGLQDRAANLSNELTKLGDSIEADSVDYNKAVARLNADIVAFNARASGGGFSSQSEFEAARSDLVSRASQLDASREAIDDEVAKYDTLRQELLRIASQSEALNRSIDSSLAPAPAI